MEQDILIPEKTVRHIVDFVKLNISNKNNVIANVTVVQNETDRQNLVNVTVEVNKLLQNEITGGNITAANVNGFRKCIRAICAKALAVSFTDTTDFLD
jgi:hypothetical protein